MLQIYKRTVNNKAGVPASEMQVSNLVVDAPEFIKDEKVVIQSATFDITYRYSLI
jgi:hypothetical protein